MREKCYFRKVLFKKIHYIKLIFSIGVTVVEKCAILNAKNSQTRLSSPQNSDENRKKLSQQLKRGQKPMENDGKAPKSQWKRQILRY